MAVDRRGMKMGRQSWKDRLAGKTGKEKQEIAGLAYGFRSGLEKANATHLERNGQKVRFEELVIPYVVPETRRKYHLDFVLPNGICVETKGKFETNDRAKHLLLKSQYPDLDLRFVFQRPHDPIYKGSKTTLAQWAEKFGFKWATKLIPVEWMLETGPSIKPETLLGT
jgi:hypothetical protein